MIWEGRVLWAEEKRNACGIFMGRPEEKKHLDLGGGIILEWNGLG